MSEMKGVGGRSTRGEWEREKGGGEGRVSEEGGR